MPARKSTSAKIGTAGKPDAFFTRQLKGEQPLSYSTAERLYGLATELFAVRPWEILGDAELFLLEDPVSGQTCYCSVMGALGEVFELFVYVGPESYRFLNTLLKGEKVEPEDFFRSTTGVSAEFVSTSELTAPDRELLRAFKHPTGRGMAAPQFRGVRPGYGPWYPTDAEGETLAACMDALLALCDRLEADESLYYWDKDEEGYYPFLTPVARRKRGTEYAIELKKVDVPPAPVPEPALLDEVRLRRITEKDYPMRGTLEADCFDSGATLGEKDERKASVYVGLVADAGSGLVFPPQAGTVADGTGNLAARAILTAIEQLQFLPNEIRVKNLELKAALAPLEQRLGIPIREAKSIPALQEARTALIGYMRGPGGMMG